MKKIILPLLMLCLAGTAFAQHPRMAKDFYLRKTGIQMHIEQELASVLKADMKPGRHRISVWSNSGWAFTFQNMYVYDHAGRMIFLQRSDMIDTPMIRQNFNYNAAGNLTERITSDYQGNGRWSLNQKIVFSYDSEGNEQGVSYYLRNNNTWVQYAGYTALIEFDPTNNIYTHINQTWFTDSGKYVDVEKIIYKLNTSGQAVLSEHYYMMNTVWSPTARYENTYDETTNNLSVSRYYVPGMKENEWIAIERDTLITWDGERILSNITQDYFAGEWTNRERYDYSYDDFGSRSMIISLYDGQDWVYLQRLISAYNEKGHQTGMYIDEWRDSEWVESFGIQFLISYDSNDNISEVIHQGFNGTDYENLYKEEFLDYLIISGIDYTSAKHLTVYPNPSGDYIQIRHEDNNTAKEILIKDLNGKTVKRVSENLSEKIDIRDLSPGTYIFQYKTQTGWLSGKFIRN